MKIAIGAIVSVLPLKGSLRSNQFDNNLKVKTIRDEQKK
jgi:hypothetical protein